MLSTAQVIDIGAAVFAVIQVYLVGQKNWTGWVFGMVSSVIYIALGIYIHLYGLMVLESILFCMYARNLVKWRKE